MQSTSNLVRQSLHGLHRRLHTGWCVEAQSLADIGGGWFLSCQVVSTGARRTQSAVARILAGKGVGDALERALRARRSMEAAFEEAMVADFEMLFSGCVGLPDANDTHVVAAALKAQAAVIVTDNLKHFPTDVLTPLNLDVRSPDDFIADTIALDPGRAVAAIRLMRGRFQKPEKTAEALLLDMEANGLTETVDSLKQHVLSL